MDRENRHDEWNREFSVVPEIIFFWETVPSFELHDSLIFEGIVEWIENVRQSEWIMYTDMYDCVEFPPYSHNYERNNYISLWNIF